MISHTWPTALRSGAIRAALLAVPVVVLTFGWAAARGVSGERLAIATVINVVLVVSVGIFVGNSGVESFGHVAFAAIGAYAVAIVATPPEIKRTKIADAPWGLADVHVDLLPAALIALVVVGVVAMLIGLVVMRMSGITSTIVTLALLVVVNVVINNWVALTGGAEAFYGIPTVMNLPIALVVTVAVLLVASVFRSSPWGLLLQASREDELAARTMGVSVQAMRLAAFVVSAVGAGAAGILLALLLGAITPNDFYLNLTFITIAMLVLGGKRSTTGAVLGVVIVTIGDEVFRWLGDGPTIGDVTIPALPGFSTLFLGVVIVVVMIWRSAGIMGDREIDDFTRTWFRPKALPRALPDAAERSTAVLRAENLVKHFQGVAAVDGVTLEVRAGEIVGLIGPNGAGKTTLLNLLSGVLASDSGVVSIDGTPLPARLSRVARSGLARTFQNIRLFGELTVRENVQVTTIVARTSHAGVVDPSDLLATFHLESSADRRAGVLAYGDQRRLEIARAAAIGRDFVLLDEPVAGMNEVESAELRDTIRELNALRGAGVLVVDHDLSFIFGLCERIYVLDAGRIIASGTPAEVSSNAVVIEAYIGSAAARHTPDPISEPASPSSKEVP
ncbi:MAG: branched-chain amino acid ABC transporter ATP-binding protein/permease [Candidatus Nanopelagicales bacterium]